MASCAKPGLPIDALAMMQPQWRVDGDGEIMGNVCGASVVDNKSLTWDRPLTTLDFVSWVRQEDWRTRPHV